MAKEETPKDQFDEVFDVMPGADKDTGEVEALDLNFGLGDEPVEEPVAEADEVEETEEVEEEVVAEAEQEEDEPVEEEPAAEETEEVVAEAEAEPEPAPEPPKDNKMVPKSRLDEVLAKQKALQKQLEDMKKAQEPPADAPEAYDFRRQRARVHEFGARWQRS